VVLSQPFSKAAAEESILESDPIDFDDKVAEGVTHLDITPNVDISFLTRCSRNYLPSLATFTSESANYGGDKDFGIIDDWIADNVAFQTCSSHSVWQPSFSTCFEKSASISKLKTWSALSSISIKSLTDEVLRAYKTLLLGKLVKIRFPNSGGSQ